MRRIGELDRREVAETFSDYLALNKISNEIDADGDAFVIWVHDDPRLATARQMLEEFLQDPSGMKYAEASQEMRRERERIVRDEARRRFEQNAAEAAAEERDARSRQLPPVTVVVALLCMVVAYHSQLGEAPAAISALYIADPSSALFGEVLEGQVWRLITPALIHVGFIHILFNLMLWFDLAGAIERVKGSWYLLAMTLLIAVVSNTGQYLFEGPLFGGLSGVVYGLFGFIWMQSRLDARSEFMMRASTVWLLLGWFFVCLTGLVPSVANWAHGLGLVIGMGWGFGAAVLARRRQA